MRVPFRLPRLVLVPIALAAVQGCANATLPPGSAPGTYLFEIDYENYAWARTHTGVVVDASGDVWSFDYGTRPTYEPEKDSYTTADLDAKYSHGRRFLRHLDAAEVAARAAQVPAAAAGPLGTETLRCVDAGGTSFRAFRYDAATDDYRPVLLLQKGVTARRNLSRDAVQLTDWLRGLDARFADTGCEP